MESRWNSKRSPRLCGCINLGDLNRPEFPLESMPKGHNTKGSALVIPPFARGSEGRDERDVPTL